MAMRNPHVRIGNRSSFMLHYRAMLVYWSISYFIHADFLLVTIFQMRSCYELKSTYEFSALHHVFIQFKTSWNIRRTFHFIISKSEETCFFWIFANKNTRKSLAIKSTRKNLFSWCGPLSLPTKKLVMQWQLIFFEATSSSSCRHPIFNLKNTSVGGSRCRFNSQYWVSQNA